MAQRHNCLVYALLLLKESEKETYGHIHTYCRIRIIGALPFSLRLNLAYGPKSCFSNERLVSAVLIAFSLIRLTPQRTSIQYIKLTIKSRKICVDYRDVCTVHIGLLA